MTDLSAEQNEMLERLLEKHDLKSYPTTIGAENALRELLQAVQERDARLCLRSRACPNYHGCHKQDELAIRAQTYADLFQEGKS